MMKTEIYADTRNVGTCNGRSCAKRILWATIAKSGKRMPFDDLELVALSTRLEPGTHRLLETVDLAGNHWATCPDAKGFKQ